MPEIFDELSELGRLLSGASPLLLLVLCPSSAKGVWFPLLTYIAAGRGQKRGRAGGESILFPILIVQCKYSKREI